MKEYLENIYGKLLFTDIAVNGDIGWFCNIYFSSLFRIDLTSGVIKLETLLPEQSKCDFNQYGPIALYGNKLVIAPRNGKYILLYDITDQKIKQLEFDMKGFEQEDQRVNLFCGVQVIGNQAVLIPGRYHAIIRINLDTEELTYLEEWYEEIKQHTRDLENLIFKKCYQSSEGDYLLPCVQTNRIVRFDQSFNTYEVIVVNTALEEFSDIIELEEGYLVSDMSDMKIALVQKNRHVKELNIEIPNMESERGIKCLMEGKDKIYLFPDYGNMIVEYDKANTFKKNRDILFHPLHGHVLSRLHQQMIFHSMNTNRIH